MELDELIAVVNEVAASLQLPMDLEATLNRNTRSAAEATPGIDHASISVTTKGGRIQTLAPTDAVATRADQLQYELLRDRATRLSRVSRWCRSTTWLRICAGRSTGPKAAAEFGIGSPLSFQFHAEPNVRGALNLYAGEPDQIDRETRQLGAMFARLVAIALGWGRHDESLSHALASRAQIGQAVGILMERYRLDPDRAFGFLVRVSQTGNVKLREVACGIIADTVAKANGR
jgi:hypothetical protein